MGEALDTLLKLAHGAGQARDPHTKRFISTGGSKSSAGGGAPPKRSVPVRIVGKKDGSKSRVELMPHEMSPKQIKNLPDEHLSKAYSTMHSHHQSAIWSPTYNGRRVENARVRLKAAHDEMMSRGLPLPKVSLGGHPGQ